MIRREILIFLGNRLIGLLRQLSDYFYFQLNIDTMPESRDRLSRPDDVRAMFALRRQSIGGFSIILDEPETSSGTPFLWGATAMTGTRGPMGVAATRSNGGVGRGSLGTPRNRTRHGRNLHRSPMSRENFPLGSSRRGRGRSTNSVLPSWYPRTPLHDITAVVRVMILFLSISEFEFKLVCLCEILIRVLV